jgi:16S rRNA (guanine(1405)-N(7))-methyltransferase
MAEITETAVKVLIDKIRKSRKYARLDIPETTLSGLFEFERSHQRSLKEAEENVRHKLHNIMAPYLGDPDYDAVSRELEEAFSAGSMVEVREVCTEILNAHASTRERYPYLERFYQDIFAIIGKPQTVLDLACGLNPFAFPWMGLPETTNYYAFDIHSPRVALINHYFSLQGLKPLAEVRDVLIDPPNMDADVAFIFKEVHRMEQRQRGCSLPFWKALKPRLLLVSLPASSLSGKHDLADRQRHLIASILEGMAWKVTELIIENEMVFCIEK